MAELIDVFNAMLKNRKRVGVDMSNGIRYCLN